MTDELPLVGAAALILGAVGVTLGVLTVAGVVVVVDKLLRPRPKPTRYLVGARGPELIVPTERGYVLTAQRPPPDLLLDRHPDL